MAKGYGTETRNDNEIDNEVMYANESIPDITEPYDPKDVDIISMPMTIFNVVERLKNNEIILNPDFQRMTNLWNDVQQSRLIESLLIRIPLPTFYFDSTDDDKYIVVDGLQRLQTIKNFAVIGENDRRKLRLKGLEYFKELNGKIFEELPLNLQRRFREQNIIAYIIRNGTPDKVRNSIFKRINTGGVVLTQDEINNSTFRGKVADLLKELASSNEFIQVTRGSIKTDRMLDRGFINRFLAFYVQGIEKYKGNFEEYLENVLIYMKNKDDDKLFESCRTDFLTAMTTAYRLFGVNAFRKKINGEKYSKINKPLFECLSVALANLDILDIEVLVSRKQSFVERFYNLMEKDSFKTSISNATAQISNVKYRHTEIVRIIEETIND